MGGAEYAESSASRTRAARGSCRLSGNAVTAGTTRSRRGLTLRELIIRPIAWHPPDGATEAVVPGGSSTVILTADEIDVGYNSTRSASFGTAMGRRACVVLDDSLCCIVTARTAFSSSNDTSRCVKCTPCREGIAWLTAICQSSKTAARPGRPRPAARLCDRSTASACARSVTPTRSSRVVRAKIRDEFTRTSNTALPVRRQLVLEGVVARSDARRPDHSRHGRPRGGARVKTTRAASPAGT